MSLPCSRERHRVSKHRRCRRSFVTTVRGRLTRRAAREAWVSLRLMPDVSLSPYENAEPTSRDHFRADRRVWLRADRTAARARVDADGTISNAWVPFTPSLPTITIAFSVAIRRVSSFRIDVFSALFTGGSSGEWAETRYGAGHTFIGWFVGWWRYPARRTSTVPELKEWLAALYVAGAQRSQGSCPGHARAFIREPRGCGTKNMPSKSSCRSMAPSRTRPANRRCTRRRRSRVWIFRTDGGVAAVSARSFARQPP